MKDYIRAIGLVLGLGLLLVLPGFANADCFTDNQGTVTLDVDGQTGQVQVRLDAPFTVNAHVYPLVCRGTYVNVYISSVNRNPGGHIWWLFPDNVWRKQDTPQVYVNAPLDVWNAAIFQGPLAPGYSGTWDFYLCYDIGGLICGTVEVVVLPY